jgi:flavodoxin
MGKILIAYFSRADENYTPGGFAVLKKGNTEIAAETAQAAAGGDLFRIERSKPYPAGYRDCVEESKKELLSDARPELADKLKDIKAYDTVVLAYPCWCGTMPMPVFTFLESVDFTGKKNIAALHQRGQRHGFQREGYPENMPRRPGRPRTPRAGQRRFFRGQAHLRLAAGKSLKYPEGSDER